LNYLDLTGNPVTKKANYQGIMKNLLPQLKGIDVFVEKFSEFENFKEVCFCISNSHSPSDESKKVSNLKLQKEENKLNIPIMKHVNSPGSEKSENFSPIQKKKFKNNIPKLNIKSLQSFDFSNIKSSVSTNLGSTKPSLQFIGGHSEYLKDLKLSTERTQQSSEESPKKSIELHPPSKLLDIKFLSHREQTSSIKFPNVNTAVPSNTVEFRKPIRVLHPNTPGEKSSKNIIEGLKLSVNKSRERSQPETPSSSSAKRNINIHLRRNNKDSHSGIQKENINTMNREILGNKKIPVKSLKLQARQTQF